MVQIPTSGNYFYLLGALSVLTSPVTNAFGSSGCVSSVDMLTSKNIAVQGSFVLVVLAVFRVVIVVFSSHFCLKHEEKSMCRDLVEFSISASLLGVTEKIRIWSLLAS